LSISKTEKLGGKMKGKIIWLILSCLLVLSLVLASCGTKTTPTTTQTTTPITMPTTAPVTVPTTTKTSIPTSTPTTAAEKPQYGGTFTYRTTADPTQWDPWYRATGFGGAWYETLAMANLTLNRNVWDFKVTYLPIKYATGRVAESWELPDTSTIIFHIRKGIHWQDIPPVNGRELTAYDIEYTWHRQLGLGSGFTKGSTLIGSNYELIASVTAIDKYTVVFKTKEPSREQIEYLFSTISHGDIVAREAVEKWGDLRDWRHIIGTGPFILVDYVSGSSWTCVKNPNYWGYDELYPENRLPYVDDLKVLIIPDNATSYAALRTGKIDMVEKIDWQQALSLKKTNPELNQVTRPNDGFGVYMHVDTKPFSDIKVRKAMQMAIDIPTIANTYYGGNAIATPMGLVGIKGYNTPFDQWPKDVRDGYSYNPQGAKKLLADAGYPSGFKCTLTTASNQDLNLAQIFKDYLAAIGINMEIQVMDPVSFSAYTTADKHTMMTGSGCLVNFPPMNNIVQRYSKQWPFQGHINDPVYDDIVLKAKASLTENEFTRLVMEADAYATAQQWVVTLPYFYNYVVYQPWLNGFNGENNGLEGVIGALSARFWIDQDLKKSIVH
jgi:peptide/nickel transport system substrate-binding protein